ncbi:MAG: 2,3-bisphosphoglycerate-dependent phosphoglycerate mutase [Actinomycetota bacterium]|nr:2,3-bisphosphoglycerate-dependent phosphoglycerate mutase [Actinomycetota bacterium]
MTTSPSPSDVASTGPDRIVFARHGHAICNRDRTIHGPTCPGLTETGTRQTHALAEKLAGNGITAVHASTTRRALDTARILAERVALPVCEEPGLRVPDPGAAEGLHWDDARSRWPLGPVYPPVPCPTTPSPGPPASTGPVELSTVSPPRAWERPWSSVAPRPSRPGTPTSSASSPSAPSASASPTAPPTPGTSRPLIPGGRSRVGNPPILSAEAESESACRPLFDQSRQYDSNVLQLIHCEDGKIMVIDIHKLWDTVDCCVLTEAVRILNEEPSIRESDMSIDKIGEREIAFSLRRLIGANYLIGKFETEIGGKYPRCTVVNVTEKGLLKSGVWRN